MDGHVEIESRSRLSAHEVHLKHFQDSGPRSCNCVRGTVLAFPACDPFTSSKKREGRVEIAPKCWANKVSIRLQRKAR